MLNCILPDLTQPNLDSAAIWPEANTVQVHGWWRKKITFPRSSCSHFIRHPVLSHSRRNQDFVLKGEIPCSLSLHLSLSLLWSQKQNDSRHLQTPPSPPQLWWSIIVLSCQICREQSSSLSLTNTGLNLVLQSRERNAAEANKHNTGKRSLLYRKRQIDWT